VVLAGLPAFWLVDMAETMGWIKNMRLFKVVKPIISG
jgi:hypothetical protein